MLENRLRRARTVEPRAVAALQIFDRVTVRTSKNPRVTCGDTEVADDDLGVALAADEVLVLDERDDGALVLATHDQQLCDGLSDHVLETERRIAGHEQARVVVDLADRAVAEVDD